MSLNLTSQGTNDSINSISEFLLHAGTHYRVFDIGRGLQMLDGQTFLDIENGLIPCPMPRLNKAWFAVVFWPVAMTPSASFSPYFWFVSLPLDEQSKVISASRNHFLQTVVEALQANKAIDNSVERSLANNPYIFKPNETQRGQVTARLLVDLKVPYTHRTELSLAYLKSPGTIDWQKLMIQDIFLASYVINTDAKLSDGLIACWPSLAESFQTILLNAFESIELNDSLFAFFLKRFRETDNTSHKLHFLRSMASETKSVNLQSAIVELLTDSSNICIDSLSVIAGRHFHQFTPAIIRLFFNACLRADQELGDDVNVFTSFYKDLVAIPELRPHILTLLRQIKN